jgi:hypothetical protein
MKFLKLSFLRVLVLIFTISFNINSMLFSADKLVDSLKQSFLNLKRPDQQIFDTIYRAYIADGRTAAADGGTAAVSWFKNDLKNFLKSNGTEIYTMAFSYQGRSISPYAFAINLAADLWKTKTIDTRYYNLIEIAKVLVDLGADLYGDVYAEYLLKEYPEIKHQIKSETTKRKSREMEVVTPRKVRVGEQGIISVF